MSSTEPTFDVALSFAGSDRLYVERVAAALRGSGLAVFYDADQQVDLWGVDLAEYLDAVYRQRSRYVVMFISQQYGERAWTRHERRSALARAIEEREPYILPARFDDTELPGLRPTISHVDLRTRSPESLAQMIMAKVGGRPPEPVEEVWEFSLFASELEAGLSRIAPRLADYRHGFAGPSGIYLADKAQVLAFIRQRSSDAVTIAGNIERLLNSNYQQQAFGAAGMAGDEEAIRHLTGSLTRTAEALVEWGLAIRGASAPETARPVLWALSRYVEAPIEQYVQFVGRFRAQIEWAQAELRAGAPGPYNLVIDLTLDIPPDVVKAFKRALKSFKRSRF